MAALRLESPRWLLALIGLRDALVSAAFLLRGTARSARVNYTALPVSKLTTALQFVALGLLVARGRATRLVTALAAAAAVAGVADAHAYARRALRPAEAARAA
jgi:phosphatidylglycerophosphate synthase